MRIKRFRYNWLAQRKAFYTLIIFFFSFGASAETAEKIPSSTQMIDQAISLISEGNFIQAVVFLDPVISAYEQKYANSSKRVYNSRDMTESLYYLMLEVVLKTSKNSDSTSSVTDCGKLKIEIDINGFGTSCSALVINSEWGNALFYKGSALISLNKFTEARVALAKAVELSPMNSTYLAEYAFSYIGNQEYEKGLEIARQAEDASEFSPDDLKIAEKTRAKRHMGYAFAELNRLDEAEAIYKECLKLDKDDKISKNELEYIKQQRQKQQAAKSN